MKLGDIIAFETGKRPKGGIVGITEGAISLGGEHIQNSKIDLTNIRYVPLEFYNGSKSGKVKNNDMLMCKDGALTGKTCIIDIKDIPQKEKSELQRIQKKI